MSFLTDLEGELHAHPRDVAQINFWYPRSNPDHVKFIEVGLIDVRAADSIRIHYDFERDGYSIEQASVFEWDDDDTQCDEGWIEVAFVQAWAKQAKPIPSR